MKKKSYVRPLLYIILVIYALVTIYPFLWAVSASFKTFKEITGGGISIIPKNPTIQNYIDLFSGTANYTRWFLNSLYVAVTSTILNIILNSMAGYALAQVNFRGSKAILGLFVATMAIPAQVLLIPNYLIIKALGMMGSYSSLIIPGAVNVSYIFLMRQYFMNFSKQVEEAAKIDGLTRVGCFFRIAIPLSVPVLATQATFSFLGFWNDFTKSMLYIKEVKKFTLPVGIQSTQSRSAGFTMWNEILTSSVVSMIPIIIIYILLNKYFMQGIKLDAEK